MNQKEEITKKYPTNTHNYFFSLKTSLSHYIFPVCQGHVYCIECKKHCCHCCSSPIEFACQKFRDWKRQLKTSCTDCKCHIDLHQMIKCERRDCKNNGGPPQRVNDKQEIVEISAVYE